MTGLQPAALPAEPWWDKNPEQWTADDLDKILNHSEWARPVVLTSLVSASGGKTSPKGGGVETSSEFTCEVRWESGLPIRLARRFLPGPMITDEKSYVLSINNLPLAFLGDSSGRTSGRLGQNQERAKEDIAAQLQQSASLLREKHEAIRAARVGWVSANFNDSVMVSFPAAEHPIQFTDGEVTFFSQIGDFHLRAIFSVKRMMYRGKLAV